MSSSENKQLRVAATFIVFVVLIIQTLLLKMNFDLRPESTMLVFYGFVASDVLSVCTWLFYSKD